MANKPRVRVRPIEGTDTGIYQRVKVSAPSNRAYMQLLAQSQDITAQVDAAEQWALSVLKNYVAQVYDPATERAKPRPSSEWPFALPEVQGLPPIAHDAREAMLAIRLLRSNIKKGNAAGAALHALRLGKLVERGCVRPFEPHAARGRKVIAGAKHGHVKTHGTKKEREALKSQVRAYVAAEINPSVKLVDFVYMKAASRFGVSPRTIRRYWESR